MSKTMKVFVKRYPSKGEFPKESRIYITNAGALHYLHPFQRWLDNDPQWWMQEIELPSEEDIEIKGREEWWYTDLEESLQPFKSGANYILNHLKQIKK